jgi:OOP family OmpA-OmpF porin
MADDIVVSKPQRMSTPMYIGVTLGSANYDEFDDSSIAYGVFGGFDINEILAINLGWSDFGEASSDGDKAEVSAFHLSLLGKLPVRTDITLFGRIGLAKWDLDATLGGQSDGDSDADIFYGVGVDYDITGQSSVRFGLDFYNLKPTLSDITQEEETISVFSVGFMFKP